MQPEIKLIDWLIDWLIDNLSPSPNPYPNPIPDQIPQLPQIPNPAVAEQYNMAEADKVILPDPFSGSPHEDASEFWRRLTTYLTYKGINDPAERLKLAKAMLTQDAADWLESLNQTQQGSFDQLKLEFESHYIKPVALRFRSANALFKERQSPNETVDAYAVRIRSLSKKVAVSDSTLLYAFVSGLRPAIATFGLGRSPETMNAAVNDARISEMANLATTNNTDMVTEQLAQMRNELQKLAQRYDSIALTAPVQEEPRPFSQPQTRRVVFEEPRQGGGPQNFRGGRSPSPRPSYGQNNRTHELPYNGGVGQNNDMRVYFLTSLESTHIPFPKIGGLQLNYPLSSQEPVKLRTSNLAGIFNGPIRINAH